MKKTLAFVSALILLLSLSACGSSSVQLPVSDAGGSRQPVWQTLASVHEAAATPEADVIAFEELVVVDNDECLIKITGIEPDNAWGYALKVYLENKSAENDYMFSVQNASVNGIQYDPFFASKLPAGQCSYERIYFAGSVLKSNLTAAFSDIEISFRVYDFMDWNADSVAEETVHVYPLGEAAANTFVRQPQSSDIVVADNGYATVIIIGCEQDENSGYTVKLFLLNKSSAEIMFSVDGATINGIAADPLYATSVSAGKCAFSSISWSAAALAESGITSIEEIELLFNAYETHNWTGTVFVNETVILNP